jgi:hypothetical protein
MRHLFLILVAAVIAVPAWAGSPFHQPLALGGGGGSVTPTTPGGTVTGANQYRSASGTFAGDDNVIDDGAGTMGLINVSATGSIGTSSNGTMSQLALSFGGNAAYNGFGFYRTSGPRIYFSNTTTNMFQWAPASSYINFYPNVFIGGSSGSNYMPNAMLEVSGTVKVSGVGTACSASNVGAYRDTTTYNSIARCNGTNWVVLASTTITIPTNTP